MPVLQVLALLFLTLGAILCPTPGMGAPLTYEVDIPDLPDGLTPVLSSVSDCVTLRPNPPDTPGLLRRRMHKDLETFAQALKSRGYFKADLSAELDAASTPARVRFRIDTGPRFVLAPPELVLEPSNPGLSSNLGDIMARLQTGSGYASNRILDVETALLERLKEHGYPAPSTTSRNVVADHAANAVAVRFTIATGQAASFGATEILGLESVSEHFVRTELAREPGKPFDRRLVDTTRERLFRSGLFRSVRIDTDHDQSAGTVAMRVHVLEAPHRSLRSGTWYYSDLGLGAGLGWTHRNAFGAGQELRLDTEISENLQRANSALILPNAGRPGQNLSLSTAYEHELTDVYETTTLSLSGIVRRSFSELQLGWGLAYSLTSVEKDELREFNLLSVPLIAEFSTADHPLEPTSGLAVAARLEPFADIEERSASFVFWNLAGRHYLPLLKDKSLILATRGRYSLLAGTSRESIPEDLLLYAGGGGSVRGYAYQYAGELDDEDKPLGGVSAVDFSTELRWRINSTYGLVLFADGGAAFSSRNPSDHETYFWGVGTGLRYYTPIGPMRLDVAVPLDRRDGVDAPFQLYVSLGQAF
jgi:translocation and assembly module TamA